MNFHKIFSMKSMVLVMYFCCTFAVSQCEEGWELHSDRCYLVVNAQVTYAEAQSACVGKGAELASISDADENLFLRDL